MYRKFLKPLLDFLLAIVLSVIMIPVILFLTVFLWVHFMKLPFFVQVRTGKNEKLFRIVKFLTMKDKRDDGCNLLSDDQRVTNVGRFLRNSGLDELPQLFNVLAGHMSFVGPRPLLPEYLPLYSDEARKRHSVKPGITGLAQVNGGNGLEWEKRFKLDVVYADKINIWLDLIILSKTILLIFKRKESHNIGSFVPDIQDTNS